MMLMRLSFLLGRDLRRLRRERSNMLEDIVLGQYFPGKSIIHRLDPRVKICLLIAMVVLIFLIDSVVGYAILIGFIIMIIAISQIPARTVLKSLKPLIWIILFTLLVHLVSHDGKILFKVWIFEVTDEGVYRGILISLRLIMLIVLSSMLTFTTSPLKLTEALERLLSPLARFGVPAHELAMMMTIALRFIPTLLEETDKIIKAQTARGVDFESGNVYERARAMVAILVPLLISAMRRAEEVAMAMEARCYRGGEGRTHMKVMEIRALDCVAVAVVMSLYGVMIMWA